MDITFLEEIFKLFWISWIFVWLYLKQNKDFNLMLKKKDELYREMINVDAEQTKAIQEIDKTLIIINNKLIKDMYDIHNEQDKLLINLDKTLEKINFETIRYINEYWEHWYWLHGKWWVNNHRPNKDICAWCSEYVECVHPNKIKMTDEERKKEKEKYIREQVKELKLKFKK